MEIQPDLSVCLNIEKSSEAGRDLIHSVLDTAGPLSSEILATGIVKSTAQIVQAEFPETSILASPRRQSPATRMNQLLGQSSGRYIVIADEDTIVKADCLQQLVNFLDDTPEAGLAGPRIVNAFGVAEPSAAIFLSSWQFFLQVSGLSRIFFRKRTGPDRPARAARRPAPVEVGWVSDSFLIIRRETFEEIGNFNRFLRPGYMGRDYCRRAVRAGWRIYYLPMAEIVHHAPQRYRFDRNPQLLSRFLYLAKSLFF